MSRWNWRIGTIILAMLLAVSAVHAAKTLDRLPTGTATVMQGGKITIDTGFLENLQKRPSGEEWKKNYWELIYLINLGYDRAISIGIDVLANVKSHRADYDDHLGVKNLAIALSGRFEFDYVLCKKPREVYR